MSSWPPDLEELARIARRLAGLRPVASASRTTSIDALAAGVVSPFSFRDCSKVSISETRLVSALDLMVHQLSRV